MVVLGLARVRVHLLLGVGWLLLKLLLAQLVLDVLV